MMLTAAARQARQAENRRKWLADPRNANVKYAARITETCEIPVEPIVQIEPSGTAALERLRSIMLDQSVPLARRLRAGAMVIRFELAPGGAAGLDQAQIESDAYKFFAAVSVADVSDEHRQLALEQLALVENSKVTRADPDAIAEAREQTVALINAHRRMALAAAGCWPVPAGSPRWALSAADDFEVPSGLQADPRSNASIAEMLDATRALDPAKRQHQADERHRLMLMVTARNRDDRAWRKLLGEPA